MPNQFHMALLPWLVVCGIIINLKVSAIAFSLPSWSLSLTAPSQNVYRLFQKTMTFSCWMAHFSEHYASPAGFVVVFVQV